MNFEYWLKICTFASCMKKLLMKISAVLLIVWYCMSIIGFDVHTCVGSGRTFIATFAEGTSCTDIHPEHHCCNSGSKDVHEHGCHETSSCCHSEQTVDNRTCCSNEYQVIMLSGCRSFSESDSEDFDFRMICPAITCPMTCVASAEFPAEQLQFWDSDSGVIPPYDYQSVYGVWRI